MTSERVAVVAFTAATAVSAGLLFSVEPLFTKMVLPLLGGTPAVWNTAVVFFQVVLLGGYAYAHLAPRLLPLRVHLTVHLLLIASPFLLLPFSIRLGSPPSGEATPIAWLLGALALGVGAPFFVLSTTGPLLQRWFAGLGHRRSHDPYFLYRGSNAGSAVGLISYPLLAEPLLPLHAQALWWECGYAVFVGVLVGAATLTWRRAPRPATSLEPTRGAARPRATPLTRLRRLRWMVLAAVPSTWMLGVTLYLSTDIAPIPLIWVVPLALYLLTFTLAFGPRRILTRRRCARLLPFLLIATVGTLALHASGPLWFIAPLHLATFFVGAMVCHGELAADRPPSSHLTEFYLWLALGGAIGSSISGLLAPLILPGFAEYPLAIVVGAMCLPFGLEPRRPRLGADVAVAALIALLVTAGTYVAALLHAPDQMARTLAFGPGAFLAFTTVRRRLRFGLALGAILMATTVSIGSGEDLLFAGRDFFGVSRVTVDRTRDLHILYSGNIVHNEQKADGADRDEPLTYFTRKGPAGDLFANVAGRSSQWRVAVIGLGAGAMACYATPGQRWTFYEIDPLVERLATDPRYFTYYSDCLAGRGQIVLGDGRLSLARAAPHAYDLIVVDAFGSDVIPVNLLTREAVDIYRAHLSPHGVLLFNISNQYVDLSGVITGLARAEHMVAWIRTDANIDATESARGHFASTWMVLASDRTDVGPLASLPGWTEARGSGPLWTDDKTDIIGVVRWR